MKIRSAPSTFTLARRDFLKLSAGAAAFPAVPTKAWAQGYPTRLVTLVVFTPAGGIPDIVARLIGDLLSQKLGQPVIIENRPGAGGNIALQAVARAPADGHTLLLVASPHAVAVSLNPNNAMSITRDIAPVASLNRDTFVLLVNPSFPANSLTEFIAYAKANPGKINLGSNGTGNLPHLAGELFRMNAGIEMLHVPYRGTPAAFAALMAGDIHALFETVGASSSPIQASKLRPLGVTSTERLRLLPNVPTIGESVPDYSVSGWLGVGVARGTPVEIVQRLSREIGTVLRDPAIAARMADLGSEPFVSSPDDFAKFIAEDAQKWSRVVEATGLAVK